MEKIINKKFETELLKGVMEEWNDFIENEQSLFYYPTLINKLEDEFKNKVVYPDLFDILKPMKLLRPNDIKVVIIGQDPYHTPGVADGFAFSSKDIKVPPSLKNIFKEIESDVKIYNTSPDLSNWANQGVFLINSVLSVEKGKAKSHHKLGWKNFVVDLIKYIDSLDENIFVLWGNDAQKYEQYLSKSFVIRGVHPSPLAGGGFFGGQYFSSINNKLKDQNKQVIDWRTDINEI